jgi:hypothetical protein
MSKRFPIPEFDRDQYRNMEWSAPKLLPRAEQERLISAARNGDEKAYGCYPVEADTAFYDRYRVTGPNRHAVMCLMPSRGVRLTGKSWAWEIQRALVVDSLDPARSSVLHDWKTPRPMNTRLGPDNGVALDGGVAFVVFGHRYGDHWIANRTLVDKKPAAAKGFSVISSSNDEANDFHACNLSFGWN